VEVGYGEAEACAGLEAAARGHHSDGGGLEGVISRED